MSVFSSVNIDIKLLIYYLIQSLWSPCSPLMVLVDRVGVD